MNKFNLVYEEIMNSIKNSDQAEADSLEEQCKKYCKLSPEQGKRKYDDDLSVRFDPSLYIKYEAADNDKTPPELLRKLIDYGEKISYVTLVRLVLENPNTPTDILEKYGNCPWEYYKGSVAINPSTPVDVLIKLSKDVSDEIRGILVDNPSLPKEIFEKLCKDKTEGVKIGLAMSEKVPVDMLIKFCEDKDEFFEVRKAAAENPRTPKEISEKTLEELDDSEESEFEEDKEAEERPKKAPRRMVE